jgi:hypothetical protein
MPPWIIRDWHVDVVVAATAVVVDDAVMDDSDVRAVVH